jgi:hypothetical protein
MKKHRGRPRILPEKRRKPGFSVRFNREERRLIDQAAREAGLSMAAWARLELLACARASYELGRPAENQVKHVELNDWNRVVSFTYGRPYNFQQQDGCRDRGVVKLTVPDEADDHERDTVPEEVNSPERGVSFEAWLARSPDRKLPGQTDAYQLRLWWERNFYPDVQMVANDLHTRGQLAAGEYGIVVDW